MNAPTQASTEIYASPSLTLALVFILLLFIFTGFFSVYFCRCFMDSMDDTRQHGNTVGDVSNAGQVGPDITPGLDPSIIESFPQFVYSTVKHFRKGGNHGLECAICLAEFDDEDMLRLLTFCCHVFHQDCIDLWLKSHKTCPVCRKNLDESPEDCALKCPILRNDSRHDTIHEDDEKLPEPIPDSVSIDIKDDSYECREPKEIKIKDVSTVFYTSENFKMNNNKEGKFPKSHSTGHSIAGIKANNADKHKLILRDDIHSRLTRRHQCSKSCTVIGEYSNSTYPIATAKDDALDNGNKV